MMAAMEARPALGGEDATKAGTKAADWKYPDGTILRFFQGAQINLYLMSPGKVKGRSIFNLEKPRAETRLPRGNRAPTGSVRDGQDVDA